MSCLSWGGSAGAWRIQRARDALKAGREERGPTCLRNPPKSSGWIEMLVGETLLTFWISWWTAGSESSNTPSRFLCRYLNAATALEELSTYQIAGDPMLTSGACRACPCRPMG